MIDVGVTIKKNIIPITIGAIKLPNNIPILNHILFKGVKIFEFIIPKTKKVTEIANDQYLISPAFSKGQVETIKNTTKKTIPKLLFELILILLLIKFVFNNIINFTCYSFISGW